MSTYLGAVAGLAYLYILIVYSRRLGASHKIKLVELSRFTGNREALRKWKARAYSIPTQQPFGGYSDV